MGGQAKGQTHGERFLQSLDLCESIPCGAKSKVIAMFQGSPSPSLKKWLEEKNRRENYTKLQCFALKKLQTRKSHSDNTKEAEELLQALGEMKEAGKHLVVFARACNASGYSVADKAKDIACIQCFIEDEDYSCWDKVRKVARKLREFEGELAKKDAVDTDDGSKHYHAEGANEISTGEKKESPPANAGQAAPHSELQREASGSGHPSGFENPSCQIKISNAAIKLNMGETGSAKKSLRRAIQRDPNRATKVPLRKGYYWFNRSHDSEDYKIFPPDREK